MYIFLKLVTFKDREFLEILHSYATFPQNFHYEKICDTTFWFSIY